MYDLKMIDGKIIKIVSAHIELLKHENYEAGVIVSLEMDGILPGHKTVKKLEYSFFAELTIIRSIKFNSKKYEVWKDDWNAFINSLEVRKFMSNSKVSDGVSSYAKNRLKI